MALRAGRGRHISQISSNSCVVTDGLTIRGIIIRQSVRLPQRKEGRQTPERCGNASERLLHTVGAKDPKDFT